MKKRIVSVMVAAAMLLTAPAALASKSVITEDKEETRDYINSTINDTTLTLEERVRYLLNGMIKTDIGGTVTGDHFVPTFVMKNRSSAVINGDVSTYLKNIGSYDPLSSSAGSIQVNNGDLNISGKALYSMENANSSNLSIINFLASDAARQHLTVGRIEGNTQNITGDIKMNGITALLDGETTGDDIGVNGDIVLDTDTDGNNNDIIGIKITAETTSPEVSRAQSNMTVSGRISIDAESPNGYATATAVDIDGDYSGMPSTFTGNFVMLLHDINVATKAAHKVGSTGLDLTGAGQSGEGFISGLLKGDIVVNAESAHDEAQARAIMIDKLGVDLLSNNFIPYKISANAVTDDDNAFVETVWINGYDRLLGNAAVSASSSALTGIAQATALKIQDGANVMVGNLTVSANGGSEATATGIFAEDVLSSAKTGNITVNAVSSDNDAPADAIGVNADYGVTVMTGNITTNAAASGGLPVSTGVKADNEAKVKTGDISASTALNDGTAKGITANNGSVVYADNVTVSGHTVFGIDADNDSIVKTGNIFVSAGNSANGVSAASGSKVKTGDISAVSSRGLGEAVSAFGTDTAVEAGDISIESAKLPMGYNIDVRNGAQLKAKNVANAGIFTDNKSSILLNNLYGGSYTINLYDGKAGDSAVLVNGTARMNDEPLFFFESSVGEDKVLANLPKLIVGKIEPDANGNGVDPDAIVDGEVLQMHTSVKFSDGIKKQIRTQAIEYVIGASQGPHYEVHLDTSNLNRYDNYGVYTAHEGDTVNFSVTTDHGYAIKAVDAGAADAIPKEEEGYYYLKVPVGGGVYITVRVRKTVYAALRQYYFYGMDPESKEWLYWLCTKVDHGIAKLVCTSGFEDIPIDFIENYCSEEEQENIVSNGYYIDPELSDRIFGDGLKHPVIDVDLFYIGY